jgi:hypothetical protein
MIGKFRALNIQFLIQNKDLLESIFQNITKIKTTQCGIKKNPLIHGTGFAI